jgi:hypothetical protein
VDSAEALAIVIPILEQFFQDNSLDQTLQRWGAMARQSPERVGPVLAAFDVLANDPTLELRPILARHGWINLFHMTETGEPVIYTPEEHREWLRALIPKLSQAATAPDPPSP